ncbi:MAG: restriction endonuclease subunit S [Neisseriaceae bacterium]|nr:restriction endonuclease subunit S [Neisseriaceae bacterium]
MNNKVFFLNRSEIEGRLDPISFHSERRETIAKLSNSRKIIRLINAVKSRKSVVTQSDNPYIGLENIQSHTGEYIESQEKETFSSANIFQAGDILFSKLRPYLNKVYLAEFDGICSTEFHIFNGNQNYLNEFLAIYLRSNLIVNQTKYLMTGNTLPRLQTEDIYNLPVPILSKDEQIEIVKKYNQAMLERKNKLTQSQTLLNSISDYLLEKLGITVPKVDNSLSSRIFICQSSELFGTRWDAENKQEKYKRLYHNLQNGKFSVAHLGSLIEFIESGSRPSGGISDISEGVLSLGGEHISQKMTLDVKTPKFISIDFHQKHLETEIQLGDVLLVKDGATTGKVAIVDNNKFVGQNINEHLFMMRFSKDVNPHFVLYFLYSEIGQRQIQHYITGATVTGITKSVVKNLKIPLPDIETQKTIVAHIKQIRKQAQNLEQQAKDLLQQTQQEIEKMILGN